MAIWNTFTIAFTAKTNCCGQFQTVGLRQARGIKLCCHSNTDKSQSMYEVPEFQSSSCFFLTFEINWNHYLLAIQILIF